MANLIRIRDVTVYTALGVNAAECYEAVKLLKDNNVPINHLNWNNEDDAANTFAPLSTWNFTANGADFSTREITRFPIVHWKIVMDDDTNGINVAVGLEELQNSQLIANLDKVVRPS
jgi:hypothetical protein